eukprot:scaffold55788_cov52-Attheya_sp.AAC.3
MNPLSVIEETRDLHVVGSNFNFAIIRVVCSVVPSCTQIIVEGCQDTTIKESKIKPTFFATRSLTKVQQTMKISCAAAFLLLSATAEGFAPVVSRSSSTTRVFSTAEPPARTAPDAGWVPEWEDRAGLSTEEFMKSDTAKADLSGMWECPYTRWDSQGIDVEKAQREAKKMPHCPLEVRASPADNEMGAEYFSKNRVKLRKDLLKYGAIWFRGFDLMKSVSGNREMHEAMSLDPCLDPLHSSGLRKFASERDALYEEVNKPSLRGHYIGLHCESTAKRTAAYAAFVCFQKATEGGGRFLVADGSAILAEIDTNVLKRLYERQIRISVSNLDIPPSFPGFIKEGIK